MRVDLYGTIHKGLRAVLFATIGDVARTDFSNDDETRSTLATVDRLLHLFEEHAAHEDRVVMPELQRLSAAVYTALADEHSRTDGMEVELNRLVSRIAGSIGDERVSLGRRLHGKLCLFASEHLRHMDREETEANRVLWAHFSDEELWGLHERITREIPPHQMAEALSFMLPAVSLKERAELVGNIYRKVPREVFVQLMAPAREALGYDGWRVTEAAACN